MTLAAMAGWNPRDLEGATLGDLERWAGAGRRWANHRARLNHLAMAAALNGGATAREFNRVTRDD